MCESTGNRPLCSHCPKSVTWKYSSFKILCSCPALFSLLRICMDEEVSIVLLPCGHLVPCGKCAPALRNYPICRNGIKGKARTFMAWRISWTFVSFQGWVSSDEQKWVSLKHILAWTHIHEFQLSHKGVSVVSEQVSEWSEWAKRASQSEQNEWMKWAVQMNVASDWVVH